MREAVDKTQNDLPFLFLRESYADYEKAVVKCDDLLAKNPSDAAAYYIRSMARFGMASLVPTEFIGDGNVSEKQIDAVCRENAKKAFEDYTQAIRLDPDVIEKNDGYQVAVLSARGMKYTFNKPVNPALFDEMMRGPSIVLRQSIFMLIGFFAFFIKTYLPPFYFLPIVVSFVGAALAFLYMRRKKREREYGYIKAEFALREEAK